MTLIKIKITTCQAWHFSHIILSDLREVTFSPHFSFEESYLKF